MPPLALRQSLLASDSDATRSAPLALRQRSHSACYLVVGPRLRGVDALTAQDDHASSLTDPMLLNRATSLGRVLFSFDTDLFKEALRRQREQIAFVGLVYSHPACQNLDRRMH